MEEIKSKEPQKFDQKFRYKVAHSFRLNDDHNAKLSEFNITFDGKKNKVQNLIAFCRAYKDRKINVRCTADDKDVILQLHSMFDNIRVVLDSTNIMRVKALRDDGVPFYFDTSLPANTYGQLVALLDLGVCAVYVSDDLCHNMEEVHKICADNGVQVRCVLNRIPSTSIGLTCKDIIYDPRDIDNLAKLYDVFEFDLDPNVEKSKHQFNVLFRAFFEEKKWFGDLGELNEDVPFPYDLRLVQKEISEYKNICSRRCDSRASRACHRCERIIEERQAILQKKGWFIRDKEQ